jgi:hypothetical protein
MRSEDNNDLKIEKGFLLVILYWFSNQNIFVSDKLFWTSRVILVCFYGGEPFLGGGPWFFCSGKPF